jgi:hypothetical protein
MNSVMRRLPVAIRDAAPHAAFPENYERARAAIIECSRIDQVADWANKAAAMATYARQIQDTAMRDAANRIQCRAIEKLGELLKELRTSRTEQIGKMAAASGISSTRIYQAKRISLAPQEVRDALIDATPAPTPSRLADECRHHSSRSSGRTVDQAYVARVLSRDAFGHSISSFVQKLKDEHFACRSSSPREIAGLVNRALSRGSPKLLTKGAIAGALFDARAIIEWLDEFVDALADLNGDK